ncbi:MAG TPA: hypothetical protein VE617_08465, partial [Propionibacteriaceae bacterium]|nr:hypothetical protein [Propionibacteriaceae bacterium]
MSGPRDRLARAGAKARAAVLRRLFRLGWRGAHRIPAPLVAATLAVAALIAVTVLVALVLPSEGGDDAEPVQPADVDLVPFRDPQGAYEISVPEDWVSASVEGDVSGVGQEAFPDDP